MNTTKIQDSDACDCKVLVTYDDKGQVVGVEVLRHCYESHLPWK